MQFVMQLCVLCKYAPLPLYGGIGLLVPSCLIGLCYIARGDRQWAVRVSFREGLRPSQSLAFCLSVSLSVSLSLSICLSVSLEDGQALGRRSDDHMEPNLGKNN